MTLELKTENFNSEVIEAEDVVMVDFYSTYCEPCKRLAPIVDEISEEYKDKLKVAKFNIDNGIEVASKFGIMGVPAVFFFKKGEIVERLSGFKPKKVLIESIEKVLE